MNPLVDPTTAAMPPHWAVLFVAVAGLGIVIVGGVVAADTLLEYVLAD